MKIKYIIPFACLLLSFTGCSDFLNIKDQSSINPAIWNSELDAELYINNIYNSCMPAFGGQDFGLGSLTSISDETPDMGSAMLLGTVSSGSVGNYQTLTYNAIRYINIALNNMKSSTLTGDARNNILGQLYFFRAWQHWQLIQLYGGVPYMRDVVDYTSTDSLMNQPRNKTSDCIKFLKQDLTLAIQELPAVWSSNQYGRITRGAAAAFLGRILMFYASPQFNPTNDITRWQDAYTANIQARDLCTKDGYALMDIASPQGTSQLPVSQDFNKIFLTKAPANKEVLIVKPYLQNIYYHGYDLSVCPNEFTNGSGRPLNTPTWDLVISFPMIDGTPAFDKNRNFIGNADITQYYKNRDPRFYATVAYNGCTYPLNSVANRRQWFYSCPLDIKDPKTGVITHTTFYAENATTDKISLTGFYCRKMVDPTLVGNTAMSQDYTDWIDMRYAEVLLNLAECAYETGDNATGDACMVAIRTRAGITPGTDGTYGIAASVAAGYSRRELVINERRVEFAFEGKRIYDLRRWNMFTNDLGTNILKLNLWKKSGSGYKFTLKNVKDTAIFLYPVKRDTISLSRVSSYFTLTKTSAGPLVKGINYITATDEATLNATSTGSYNFFDIPTSILTRSPAIKNTSGWLVNGFDPFQ